MVTFANGKTLETIAVYGGSMQYQDAQRKTLEIVCAVSALSLDEAKGLWTDAAATSEITVAETITNPVTVNTDSGDMTVSVKTETVQSVHVNFTLPVELRMDSAGLHIKLAQKSALESAGRKNAGKRGYIMDSSIIVALIGGGVTVGNVIFTTLATRKQKRDERTEQLEAGVQCLLRAEIIRSHEKYTERGKCPIYAREALTRAYKAYHALGGNDVATELYNELMELPNN